MMLIRDIDPLVRAILTAMFGIVVHFGTVWTIEDLFSRDDYPHQVDAAFTPSSPTTWLPTLLLLHEYWVYLQHMNVLANPLLQHLDRRYGIALLKSKKHLVIANTLSAYWTREMLGMFLCLPYLTVLPSTFSSSYDFSLTHYLILYSLLYHTYKSRGVKKDASQLASSVPFGIMTLVIDEFYFHSLQEMVLSVFRLFLQGLDSFIHYCIVRDLLWSILTSTSTTITAAATTTTTTPSFVYSTRDAAWIMMEDTALNETIDRDTPFPSFGSNVMIKIHILFLVWVIHAALNQFFRCSTASIMVFWWQSMTTRKKTGEIQTSTTIISTRSASLDTTKQIELAAAAAARGGGGVLGERQKKEWHRLRNSKHYDVGGRIVDVPSSAPDRIRSISSSQCSDRQSISSSRDDDDDDVDEDDVSSVCCSNSSTSIHDRRSGVGRNFNSNLQKHIKEEEDFIVRRLLLPQDSFDNKNNIGNKIFDDRSVAVDGTVRLSTAISLLSVFFMIGLRQTPLKALPWMMAMMTTCGSIDMHPYFSNKNWLVGVVGLIRDQKHRFAHLAIYSWILWSLLHAAQRVLLKIPQLYQPSKQSSLNIRKQSLFQILDLILLMGVSPYVTSGIRTRQFILLICVLLTLKAYAQSMRFPKVIRYGLGLLEFASKLAMLRVLSTSAVVGEAIAALSFTLTMVWIVYVMAEGTKLSNDGAHPQRKLNSVPENDNDDSVVDVVFLGHPAFLSDSWALWLLPYSLKERWQAPLWTTPLWPIHYIVGWVVCHWGLANYFLGDDHRYDGLRMQNWIAPHFGRHFVTHPHQVKMNIEACAHDAERMGVRVLCLGALNKAESINGGGWGVSRALGPNRKLSIIHGNHLTAAAVVETVYMCFGKRKTKLFLTGASSKVGWAVAQTLRDRYGYEILCHSTDPGRREYFELHGFLSASTLAEGSAYCRNWIVGKYDTDVCETIPHGAVAIVFSVPHPLETRRDLNVIEAGTLHLDLSRLDKPRTFANKLKEHEIFACHAAGFVAAHRLKEQRSYLVRIDETGPIDLNEMNGWLIDAKKLGFSVPFVEPIVPESSLSECLGDDLPPVVIVGGGPSGLSVAAYLSQNHVPNIVLEAETNPDIFGSWSHHFSGLEITTQKKYCNLPGLRMNDREYLKEYVTAEQYQQYLKQYVHRHAINLRRGARVSSIERGSDQNPYIVKYGEKEDIMAAWAVVVSSGKHRTPQRLCGNETNTLAHKLKSSGIYCVHSSELCNDKIWSQAISAARKGRLCIIGFGNSAGDLASTILQKCDGYDCFDMDDRDSRNNDLNRKYSNHNCDAKTDDDTIMNKPVIHIATRTVPPVFPRRIKFFHVDTIGYLLRAIPCSLLQDSAVRFLWRVLPGSRACNSAFPSHLRRWKCIQGRVPVIDKHGLLVDGFLHGKLLGHGPIVDITDEKMVQFDDDQKVPIMVGSGRKNDESEPSSSASSTPPPPPPTTTTTTTSTTSSRVLIDMVIQATGYKEENIIEREDRLNGLYKCGLGSSDRFLPLITIGEDAKCIADDIIASRRIMSHPQCGSSRRRR